MYRGTRGISLLVEGQGLIASANLHGKTLIHFQITSVNAIVPEVSVGLEPSKVAILACEVSSIRNNVLVHLSTVFVRVIRKFILMSKVRIVLGRKGTDGWFSKWISSLLKAEQSHVKTLRSSHKKSVS